MKINPNVIAWLMEGDPSIRWQTQRDLLNLPPLAYQPERTKVSTAGWGARLLALQDAEGKWAGGMYQPKWTSSTYTMLTLRQLGLAPEDPHAQKTCRLFLEQGFYTDGGINFFARNIKHSETCISGMILALLSYFRYPDDRLHSICVYLLGQQMPDGGWNCESYRGDTHSSFHTTLLVLEGLFEYEQAYPSACQGVAAARERGHQFLWAHRLYKSHRTGEVFDPAMTRLTFPQRWRYDILRALDYFRACNARHQAGMSDALALLEKKCRPEGTWRINSGMSGKIYFEFEKAGQPSRWSTLCALRILAWWHGGT